MAYVKVFDRILDSSLWDESATTRCAWFALMLLADQDGYVYGTVRALARSANLKPEEMQAALDLFQQPDPNSTSEQDNGRRLVLEAPNTWRLVTYLHYRDMKDANTIRAQTRERVRKHRERRGESVTVTPCDSGVTPGNADVTLCNAAVTPSNAKQKQKQKQKQIEQEQEQVPHPCQKPGAGAAHKVVLDLGTYEWEGITEQDRAGWSTAYPAVDLDAELAKAREWVRADPAKRRKVQWRSFLVNWFSRCQDRASRGSGGVPGPAPRTRYQQAIDALPDHGEG